MSNTKHSTCAMRALAKSAKSRHGLGSYDKDEILAPKSVSPDQKELYVKLIKMRRDGKEVANPIQEFSDREKIKSLSHEERQRYILNLAADYMLAKRLVDERLKRGQARLTFIVFKNGIMRDFAHIHTLSCVFDGIKCVLCKHRLFSHIDCRHKTHRIFCDFTSLPHSKYAARNHTKRKVSHLIIFCRFCKTERKILCDLRRFLTYKSDVCPTSQIFFLFNH